MKRILLGVGNRLSADDGIGPAVAARLQGPNDGGWHAIDAGIALENASGIVARERPDFLVVVDAARMGLPPGSIRRVSIGSCDHMLASTHGLPLSFVLDRLGDSAGEIELIGVEPLSLAFGEPMSQVAADAVDRLVEILRASDLAGIPLHRTSDDPVA